jgi:hypothetical protein
MTQNLIDVVRSLYKREFNTQETMQLLASDFWTYATWGVSKRVNMENKGLLLKVNGRKHKGYVLITLDWCDVYIVHIISTHGNIEKTYDMVYCDMLFETIDEHIEKIPEYKH